MFNSTCKWRHGFYWSRLFRFLIFVICAWHTSVQHFKQIEPPMPFAVLVIHRTKVAVQYTHDATSAASRIRIRSWVPSIGDINFTRKEAVYCVWCFVCAADYLVQYSVLSCGKLFWEDSNVSKYVNHNEQCNRFPWWPLRSLFVIVIALKFFVYKAFWACVLCTSSVGGICWQLVHLS